MRKEVEEALENIESKLDKVRSLVENSKTDEYTRSVDTGHNIYYNNKIYYLVDKKKMDELLKEEIE